MPWRRPSRDPYALLIGDAGRAGRRVRTLTLGRMRPPDRLVRRAARERRRRVARFFAAVGASAVARGRATGPAGRTAAVTVMAAGSPAAEFWIAHEDGTIEPDPALRRAHSRADLEALVAAGRLFLEPGV